MKDRQRILFAFMGVWEEHGIAGSVHGREYSSKAICDWDRTVRPNEIPKEILGLVTGKISQDSITCESYCGGTHIYNREN